MKIFLMLLLNCIACFIYSLYKLKLQNVSITIYPTNNDCSAQKLLDEHGAKCHR